MRKGNIGAGFLGSALAAILITGLTTPALAEPGRSVPWQLYFQDMVTAVGADLVLFHDYLLIMCIVVSIFVFILMAILVLRFNEKSNPVPSKTTHHTGLEVVWTLAPIIILIAIAIPSFRLLYKQYDFPKPDVTIKAIGNQWYWSYEYPDAGDMSFDSIMLEDDELKEGQPRLLAVDNDVVVPVNKNIEVIITAADVLHAWAVPAFGVKVDAVPGRVIRAWFRAEKTGTYYGQCSELCGIKHGFMPIAVRVVSQGDYEKWLIKAKQEFAAYKAAPGRGKSRGGKSLVALAAE